MEASDDSRKLGELMAGDLGTQEGWIQRLKKCQCSVEDERAAMVNYNALCVTKGQMKGF